MVKRESTATTSSSPSSGPSSASAQLPTPAAGIQTARTPENIDYDDAVPRVKIDLDSLVSVTTTTTPPTTTNVISASSPSMVQETERESSSSRTNGDVTSLSTTVEVALSPSSAVCTGRPRRKRTQRRDYQGCVAGERDFDDDEDGDYVPRARTSSKKTRGKSVKSAAVAAVVASRGVETLPDAEEGNGESKDDDTRTGEVDGEERRYNSRPSLTAKSSCMCEVCGRTFKAQLNLRVHVRNVHTRVRNFKCLQCDKVFVTRYLLLEHAKAEHEGLPCHLCPICGKG